MPLRLPAPLPGGCGPAPLPGGCGAVQGSSPQHAPHHGRRCWRSALPLTCCRRVRGSAPPPGPPRSPAGRAGSRASTPARRQRQHTSTHCHQGEGGWAASRAGKRSPGRESRQQATKARQAPSVARLNPCPGASMLSSPSAVLQGSCKHMLACPRAPPPPCPASRHSPAHLEPPDVHPVSHHHHSISQPLITLTTPQQGCVHRAAPAKGGEGEASSSVGQPCRLSGMG